MLDGYLVILTVVGVLTLAGVAYLIGKGHRLELPVHAPLQAHCCGHGHVAGIRDLGERVAMLEAMQVGNGTDPKVREALQAVITDLEALTARVAAQDIQVTALKEKDEALRAKLATVEQNARVAHQRITDLTKQVTLLTGSRPNWTAALISGVLMALIYTVLAVMCHPGTFTNGWQQAVTDLIDQIPFIAIIGLTGAAVGLIVSATLFRRPLERNGS